MAKTVLPYADRTSIILFFVKNLFLGAYCESFGSSVSEIVDASHRNIDLGYSVLAIRKRKATKVAESQPMLRSMQSRRCIIAFFLLFSLPSVAPTHTWDASIQDAAKAAAENENKLALNF